MAVATQPKPLTHALPGGSEGATVTLRPLLGGEILGPERLFAGEPRPLNQLRTLLSSRKSWIWVPIPAFLIEHPSAGLVLVDTAMHPSVEVDPKANLGRIGAMASTVRNIDGGIPQRLRDLDIEPYDIETVVMTHLHTDHASGVVEFPQATFVVDRREWDAASEGSRPAFRGYHRPHFDHAFDWRAIDYEADMVESLSPFGQTIDLFGDGSVRLVATPGHTLGHQSLVLRLKGRDALLTGDAAYWKRTIDEDEGVDPLLMHDEHQFRRSLKEIKRFVEREPEAVVITGHDPETWPALDSVYT